MCCSWQQCAMSKLYVFSFLINVIGFLFRNNGVVKFGLWQLLGFVSYIAMLRNFGCRFPGKTNYVSSGEGHG